MFFPSGNNRSHTPTTLLSTPQFSTMTTTSSRQPPQALPINLLPSIDMTTLSQSQLRSLSLSSHSHLHSNDVVSPSIDRSTFNESAGSRRQTYSRSSSSSSSHHRHHHHRLSSLLPNPNHNPIPNPNDQADRVENFSIINFLKELLAAHPDFHELAYLDFDIFNNFDGSGFGNVSNVNIEALNSSYIQELPLAVNGGSVVRKRKRGRKPKAKGLGAAGIGLEIVNRNGVAVNISELALLEDPYKDELRMRTAGLVKEDELLGFLNQLGGQWCSRRRKRKIIDACEFGDFLPIDWKLLLGLKRKEGRTWVYCRRYISPGGIQFVSCKDAAAYLQSFFGPYDGQPAKDPPTTHMQHDGEVDSENFVVPVEVEDNCGQDNETQKEISLSEFGNWTEVEVLDLFECQKCSMKFDEKDGYLQHILSFHQGTARRDRHGSSVGDGCQIELQKSVDSLSKDEFPTRISKMDALIEIAQNSILENSRNSDDCNGDFTSEKVNQISVEKFSASPTDHELLDYDSPLSNQGFEDEMIENSVEMVFYTHDSRYEVFRTKMRRIDDSGVGRNSSSANPQYDGIPITIGGEGIMASANDHMDESNISHSKRPKGDSLASLSNKNNDADNDVSAVASEELLQLSKPEELDNNKNTKIKIGLGAQITILQNDNLQESLQQSVIHVNHNTFSEDHSSALHSQGCPSSNAVLNEGEIPSSTIIDQSPVKPTGFEELRSGELEQSKFSSGAMQGSLSEPLIAVVESEKITQMEEVVNGDQFDPQVVLDTTDGSELVTMCIWCGVEFSVEALHAEIQSDSVGYMCPTCKAKIS